MQQHALKQIVHFESFDAEQTQRFLAYCMTNFCSTLLAAHPITDVKQIKEITLKVSPCRDFYKDSLLFDFRIITKEKTDE